MKTLIVIIIAGFMILPSRVFSDEYSKYVKANGKIHFCSSFKTGLFNVVVTTITGEKIKIPIDQFEGYQDENERFDMMPLDNNPESIKILMKFVALKKGLSLYEIPDKEAYKHYYRVYKDGKLHERVTESNAKEILRFFGITYIDAL